MDIVERLKRWMLMHTAPAPLDLDHPAQIDIAEAADEIESLRAHAIDVSFRHVDRVKELERERDTAIRERDACKTDAERYRWLRDNGEVPERIFTGKIPLPEHERYVSDSKLDTAIDAAIAAQSKETE